jgi:Ulp1 family protease
VSTTSAASKSAIAATASYTQQKCNRVMQIDATDLKHLDPEKFLSDSNIDFYLRYNYINIRIRYQ